MSELRKTPIIDKNGFSTTRIKRTGPNPLAVVRSLPLPKLPLIERRGAVMGTLSDIQRAGEPIQSADGKNVVVSGPDSSVPEGYLTATAKVLGIVTTYILEEAPSGKQEDARIIGRIELRERGRGNEAYAGSNIKGGGWLGSSLISEDAVARMIALSKDVDDD